jgi:Domain of unknown function (DUF4258)
MKPIRFSPHALKNLAVRQIERALAESAIRNPDLRVPSRLPREVVTLAYYDTVLSAKAVLRVVIEESDDEIAVITLYKSTNLKKYLP